MTNSLDGLPPSAMLSDRPDLGDSGGPMTIDTDGAQEGVTRMTLDEAISQIDDATTFADYQDLMGFPNPAVMIAYVQHGLTPTLVVKMLRGYPEVSVARVATQEYIKRTGSDPDLRVQALADIHDPDVTPDSLIDYHQSADPELSSAAAEVLVGIDTIPPDEEGLNRELGRVSRANSASELAGLYDSERTLVRWAALFSAALSDSQLEELTRDRNDRLARVARAKLEKRQVAAGMEAARGNAVQVLGE